MRPSETGFDPTKTVFDPKEPPGFYPPAPEYDELAAYWAFVERRLPEIRSAKRRGRSASASDR